MKLMKASAGSGKTHNLSQTYINLLLNSPEDHPYRHILAVTFTNKATEEMKSRILKDLAELSSTNPKAEKILVELLHDYSAFSVSTIDRFFQQTLKSFSREIGRFADYQIELDRNSLICEAMDNILDSLTEDKTELLSWIRQSVSETLEKGNKVSIEDGLYEIGKRLKSEEHRKLAELNGIKAAEEFPPQRLAAIRKECRAVMKDFEAKAAALGIFRGDNGAYKVPSRTARAKSPELDELFGRPYDFFVTASILDSMVFNLGLASEFNREFSNLLQEKNVMCLDESNTVLRDIIDGSDAPFVYEKTGVRYDHFLLDEFQDTSNIQWSNFLPLLKESESRGNDNLIVGDVKQSIYRFRDSDWKLLASEVDGCFPGAATVQLRDNWRSSDSIVHFNNGLFEWIAGNIGLKDIYSDVAQGLGRRHEQCGNVKVEFRSDQVDAVLESVRRALDAGARYSDIGILVRNGQRGALIANRLISEGIPVISDDSLNVKTALSVRTLVSLLAGMDNPDNSIYAYLAGNLNVDYPSEYHSLVDLCEALIRSMRDADPEPFAREYLYVQSFMDFVHNWVAANGNSIREFIRYWESPDTRCTLSSPGSSDAVRILTIHKSKGLEFNYAIVPFADDIVLYKYDTHWCPLNTAGTPFSDALDGIYPVSLSSTAENSLFRDSLQKERFLQLVDNMNILYVALTRPRKCLHIIAKVPSNACASTVGKAVMKYSNFSELIFHYLGGQSCFELGPMYDFTRMERKEETVAASFPASYRSYPVGKRLQPSADAAEFFGEDGLTGAQASPRLKGIVLHRIMEEIRVTADLRPAVTAAVSDGLLGPAEGEAAYLLLTKRIASHPAWFPSDPASVRNEVSIIGPDGSEHRPDRVVELPDGSVDIIDYKFGNESPKHISQVQQYARLYRQLGFVRVNGYVWYVNDDYLRSVTIQELPADELS